MLAQFPFRLRGFHADNGCEYVNHQVAALLEKQRIDFTRSRPGKSNDKALVESRRYPYEALMTPYEKLQSLPKAKPTLKVGERFEILETIARKKSDNEAADRLPEARRELFNIIHERNWKRA